MTDTINTPAGLIRPEVELVGQDGNAFSIIGRTVTALKQAGNTDEVVNAYAEDALSRDYNHALRVTMAYTEVP